MCKIAIIGAGVSGLSAANCLKDNYKVTIFEKDDKPGGLIKCRKVNGSLFHTCGGHVFNSKRQDVLDWFQSRFLFEKEFIKTDRNSVVFMNNGKKIPYPIENHMYLFDVNTQRSFIADLVNMVKRGKQKPTNFEEFLKGRFGETLFNIYFQPYNEKIWQRDLRQVPLAWLEGKLPMPTVEEMIFNNINHIEEKIFVHSSFWYEKKNGSQYIADKLADGLDIRYNTDIKQLIFANGKWVILGEFFDKVVFCGNIKDMMGMIEGVDISSFIQNVYNLEYHGTTSVFCEIDNNPYSWIYLPSRNFKSHRIICTGNFSQENNSSHIPDGRITATIEFTDEISKEEILENLKRMPLNPLFMDFQYNRYTYPIQDSDTRNMIKQLKELLSKYDFYFTGRFADWEYYNMDVAMGAAIDLCNSIKG